MPRLHYLLVIVILTVATLIEYHVIHRYQDDKRSLQIQVIIYQDDNQRFVRALLLSNAELDKVNEAYWRLEHERHFTFEGFKIER